MWHREAPEVCDGAGGVGGSISNTCFWERVLFLIHTGSSNSLEDMIYGVGVDRILTSSDMLILASIGAENLVALGYDGEGVEEEAVY